MKKLSIGVRLMAWYVAIFALGEILFGGSMWFILRNNLYDLVDDQLESQMEDVKTFLQAQSEGASTEHLQKELSGTYAIAHTGDFLQITTETGDVIFQSNFLQTHPSLLLPANRIDSLAIQSRSVEDKHFRFAFEKLNLGSRIYTVTMGATADDAVATLELFRSSLLMFAPLLLIVAAGVGYWMSRRALAPVDALVRTARNIGGPNLSSRLEKLETGDELERLADTLNEMLGRIESAFLRVTQFTADASHELRTPVSLMRTEAELALRRSRTEGEYRESLRHILEESERTTLLIEQLLELARADSGRESVDLHPFDLRRTLRKVAEGWRQVAEVRSLEFSSAICDETMYVMGDQTLLRRLADILLDNAFKYTPSPGSVRLLLKQTEDNVVITVQDSGVGIAKEEQGKIFDRFYRLDKSRNRLQGGAGLGLAIAKWIVLQHHGSITVASDPGEGAMFRVELPKAATPVESTLQA
jgi:heavy metal sensor kinase